MKTKKLSKRELAQLASANNWMAAIYDNNSILVRTLSGRDDDWQPVTDEQLRRFLNENES